MAKTGLSYYQAETDRFQDIKVKRLKKRYGCEGYAVYQYIQNEIYRVEGCYIRFTDDQLFDVSEYWGIEEQRVEKSLNIARKWNCSTPLPGIRIMYLLPWIFSSDTLKSAGEPRRRL